MTLDTCHVTPDTWHLKTDFFVGGGIFCIGAIIRKRQEIQCLCLQDLKKNFLDYFTKYPSIGAIYLVAGLTI